MKSIKTPFLGLLLMGSLVVCAQENPKAVKYRRSSLHMIMLDDAGLVNSKIIKDAYNKAPIPDKFNDHTLTQRAFDPSTITVTEEERNAAGVKKGSKLGAMAKGAAENATGGLVDATDTKDLPIKFDKYFNTNAVAKELVAKWFNRSAKGTFNMNLIGERGSYDASALDINKAKASARGLAVLADAGEELIGNTFVVITRFNYISKEELAAAAKKAGGAIGGALGSKMPAGTTQLAGAATDALAKGYVVQSTSYLYKLVWNDSVQAVFYQDLWMDDSNFDAKRKEAFDKTNLFKLQLIGDEKALADVQSSVFSKKSDDELIARATVKSVDAVIAKLQKKYEVFRTKTPLYSADPATAKIGMKEGLEPGDKFEVLEQTMDEKTGRTKYVKKGKISVVKGQIWDNRMTPEEMAADTSKVKLDRTTFKGGKGLYPGMLIRQK